MAIRESALNAITSIATSDFVRAVTSAGASSKVTVSNLAKAIIENYTGSSLGGSTRSIKSAIDALNNSQITEISAVQLNESVTATANTSSQVVFDVSSSVSGYDSWAILYVNSQSANVLAANYWISSATSITAYYRNIAGSAITTTAQAAILRWK